MVRPLRIMALGLIGLAIIGLSGCNFGRLMTNPDVQLAAPHNATLPPSVDDARLPLVNGQGPPLEDPPDSIKAKGEKILRGLTQNQPLLTISGVSSSTILGTTRSWLGVPYAWGGNSRSGIDCSHLVYQVYRGSGIGSYPYMTTSQMKTAYYFMCVNWNNGGDIVLFRSLSHTGIYVGGGWMIDADSYYNKVMYDNLNTAYWQQWGPYPVRWTR